MKKVIERIVESPGAPNENDLWLNGATLKKFQNGEWIPVGGSTGEDTELVIAQALNDLNERIKELQEQNAQQDYINIHVSSSLDAPSDFATEVFPILEEKMKQGCLLDCVLVDVDSTQFAKILTYETVDGNLYQVDYMYGGETRYIRADLE